MISHIVLFNLKESVDRTTLRSFANELQGLIREVPGLIWAVVGRSAAVDPGYERSFGDKTYEMVAILTFTDRGDLVAYLRHPLHDQIGRKFWEYSESAVIAEMETVDARAGDLAELLAE